AQLFYLVAGRRGKWSKPDLSRHPLALRQDRRYRPRQASSRLRLQPHLSSDSEHAVAAGGAAIARYRNYRQISAKDRLIDWLDQLVATSAKDTNSLSCNWTRLWPTRSRYHSTAEPITIRSTSKRKLAATKPSIRYMVACRISTAAAPASAASALFSIAKRALAKRPRFGSGDKIFMSPAEKVTTA